MSATPSARFGATDHFAVGWYWLLASAEVPRGSVRAAELHGRALAVWRGDDGVVRVVDAHCPHMGAHLAEGRVEGDGLRCFFHAWKFGPDGACVDIPCLPKPVAVQLRTWPAEERYGLIWVWTGAAPTAPVPEVPELAGQPTLARVAGHWQKACHPNVVMINAIDAQHFNSVHQLPAVLDMRRHDVSGSAISFSNAVPPRDDTWFGRLLRRLYAGPITYSLRYWFGHTGCVTLGPDRQHFHILFAIRGAPGGHAEGRTVLVTRRRPGPLGWLWGQALLVATGIVGHYFARGDTQVFRTIRFDLRTPIAADQAIVAFVRHYDAQPAAAWGSWEPVS